jgi:hypothetical protein
MAKKQQTNSTPPDKKGPPSRHKKANRPNVERFLLNTCNRLPLAVAIRKSHQVIGRGGKNSSIAVKSK